MTVGSGPVVSVVLPTYNRGHFLRQAVDSVVQQTFTSWELVVVDDGSTDGSAAEVAHLGDPRITVLVIEHSGSPARARNVGVAAARGRWIAFLDSDDLWLPSKLATQLGELSSHPTARWSCTGFGFVDERGDRVARHAAETYEPRSGWIVEPLIAFRAVASLTTLVVERSLIVEAGGFDETLATHEDYDLELRLARRAELCALREPLTLIREHPARTTHGHHVAELHAGSARVFRKAAESAPTWRERRLCVRQCATQLVARARVLSQEGRHREALASAVRAALNAPAYPLVWRAGAGCTYRAVSAAIRH